MDAHKSITKQDKNNINDPQKKHRLETVSKNIFGGFKPVKRCTNHILSSDVDCDFTYNVFFSVVLFDSGIENNTNFVT